MAWHGMTGVLAYMGSGLADMVRIFFIYGKVFGEDIYMYFTVQQVRHDFIQVSRQVTILLDRVSGWCN